MNFMPKKIIWHPFNKKKSSSRTKKSNLATKKKKSIWKLVSFKKVLSKQKGPNPWSKNSKPNKPTSKNPSKKVNKASFNTKILSRKSKTTPNPKSDPKTSKRPKHNTFLTSPKSKKYSKKTKKNQKTFQTLWKILKHSKPNWPALRKKTHHFLNSKASSKSWKTSKTQSKNTKRPYQTWTNSCPNSLKSTLKSSKNKLKCFLRSRSKNKIKKTSKPSLILWPTSTQKMKSKSSNSLTHWAEEWTQTQSTSKKDSFSTPDTKFSSQKSPITSSKSTLLPNPPNQSETKKKNFFRTLN